RAAGADRRAFPSTPRSTTEVLGVAALLGRDFDLSLLPSAVPLPSVISTLQGGARLAANPTEGVQQWAPMIVPPPPGGSCPPTSSARGIANGRGTSTPACSEARSCGRASRRSSSWRTDG